MNARHINSVAAALAAVLGVGVMAAGCGDKGGSGFVPAAGVTITTASPLPLGQVNAAYTTGLAASGGATPYFWTLSSGSLPPGLALDSNTGVISGTPSTAGTSSFRIRVTDPTNATAEKDFVATVLPPPLTIVTSSPLPAGTVGTPYSLTFQTTGGNAPFTWAVGTTGGLSSLPAGLSLDTSTGTLSGTPTAAGTTSFQVTVQGTATMGAGGGGASAVFSLTIN